MCTRILRRGENVCTDRTFVKDKKENSNEPQRYSVEIILGFKNASEDGGQKNTNEKQERDERLGPPDWLYAPERLEKGDFLEFFCTISVICGPLLVTKSTYPS